MICAINILSIRQRAPNIPSPNPTYHRHVVYRTIKLPNTGPIFKPARSAQIYKDVPKLFACPGLQTSLTMPDVMFAKVPEHAPVMMRVTIIVAKFFAAA
jgi:hypothetical protein